MFVHLEAVVKHIHAGGFLRAFALFWFHAQLAGQWLNCLEGAIAGISLLRHHTLSSQLAP